ncbi:conserved protein of unknown function [Cyanobium sp. NIES-981]|nr:conserved protein of unknown function [Cyanobium sp. NIES-981]
MFTLRNTVMTVGELFLESVSTGVITPAELHWLTQRQNLFSRVEEAAAVRLGRLLDQGEIQLGCRLGHRPAPSGGFPAA